MNTKAGIVLLIILILAIVAIVKVAEMFKPHDVQADATKFVLEDLHFKYKNADVEILEMKNMTNPEGQKYVEIKAKVTTQQNTPCPERMHIFYNYPVQNFVPQPAEVITANCQACTEGPNCILAFPEEAVIASHTFAGTEDVAAYLTVYNQPAVSTAVENANSWTVTWDSPDSPYYYVVEIMKNKTVKSVTRVPKQ